jgi:predicted nucleic acid-binding protein
LKREISADVLPREESLTAPQLFDYEFANALWKTSKFSNLSQVEAKNFFEAVEKLDIEKVAVDSFELFRFARETGLTAYDASYLLLAEKNGGSLATFDKDLAAAARRRSVPIFGL